MLLFSILNGFRSLRKGVAESRMIGFTRPRNSRTVLGRRFVMSFVEHYQINVVTKSFVASPADIESDEHLHGHKHDRAVFAKLAKDDIPRVFDKPVELPRREVLQLGREVPDGSLVELLHLPFQYPALVNDIRVLCEPYLGTKIDFVLFYKNVAADLARELVTYRFARRQDQNIPYLWGCLRQTGNNRRFARSCRMAHEKSPGADFPAETALRKLPR